MVANAERAKRLLDQVTSGPGMRVVAYYRMSSDEQTASIEQQRKACRAHAERNGWHIIEEYEDAGRSGSKDIHKRVAFHRMIADAARGEWKAVLVWDTSRFSRQDPLDAAEAKRTLRASGVHLECVGEGKIDWGTAMGRMMDYVRSEQNHDYSLKIGSNSVRGRMDVARQGFWPHGLVPYGFSREFYDGDRKVAEARRDQKVGKHRGWRVKLSPHDPEGAAVRWLFDQFARRDLSIRQLAGEAAAKGWPLPQCGRGSWTYDSVDWILRNPAYAGDTPIGQNRRWNHLAGRSFHRCERIVVAETHDALVSRETWTAVQAKLEKLKTGKRKVRMSDSPLAGVLVCGHCGYTMVRGGGRSKDGRYYVCNSAAKRPADGCRYRTVSEGKIIRFVCKSLVEAIDFETLRALKAKPEKTDVAELARLRARRTELERDVATGTKNLLRADPSVFAIMDEELRRWKAELDKVENTIALAEAGPTPKADVGAVLKWWERERAALITVADAEWRDVKPGQEIDRSEPACLEQHDGATHRYLRRPLMMKADELRNLLHTLNAKVHLHWLPNGCRNWKLDYGRLTAELDTSALGLALTSPSLKVVRVPRNGSPGQIVDLPGKSGGLLGAKLSTMQGSRSITRSRCSTS